MRCRVSAIASWLPRRLSVTVAGTSFEALSLTCSEGDWPTGQRVVVEFSTMEQPQRWYNSAEYAEALAVPQTALSRCLLLVEDVSDQK
jgi:uncharacterized protein (DUF1330 family)